MHFCEPGDWYSTAWRGGGFSRCFLELVGSIAAAGVLFLIGCSAVVLLPASRKSGERLPRLSVVCCVSVFLSSLLAASFALDLVVKGVLHISGDEIFGYVVVVDSVGMASWMFVIALLYRERVAIVQNRPHGLAVVLFWVLTGVWLSLQLLSWANPQWWWRLETTADVSDLVVFISRVTFLSLLFVVGVFRPLCFRAHRSASYSLVVNQEEDEEEERQRQQQQQQHQREGSFVTEKHNSTFGDIWHKTKLIFPYVFPRGRPLLQLRVLTCFFILVAGRVINVYVPVYYKKIINALTPGNGTTDQLDLSYGWADAATGITFPLVSIIIYTFLRFLQVHVDAL